MFVLMYRLTKR